MERYLPWFILKHVPGVGNLLFKRLIDRFQTPDQVFQASDHRLLSVEGITPRLIQAIRKQKLPDIAQKDLELVYQKNIQLVTLADLNYPALLKEIPDPPPFLYVLGNLERMYPAIAVVGSRNATEYGITTTHRLCADLALLGLTVVSGMARGIDTAAHEGALQANGRTIAVLGSGLERIYPIENTALYHRIAESGAVISELPLLTWPDAHQFPQRNRIISGLTLGTVVVEASRNSGSLITARMALEQGREVFAVPGNIHSFKSMGTHTLIKSGAKLVEHARDIMDELSPLMIQPENVIRKPNDAAAPSRQSVLLTPDEQAVMAELSLYPIHADDLVRKLSLKPGKLGSLLIQLELKGLIRQAAGNYYSLPEHS
ncbi:MAG: DNA-processing protein DprA [Desulfatirhabdiaceae bacterium]